MKIKALAALCKAAGKQAYIFKEYDRNGNFCRQYISEGHAIYPADDLPEMNSEFLLTIFDVPGKDKPDWVVKELKDFPKYINFDPFADGEELLEDSRLTVSYLNRPSKVLFGKDRTIFIDTTYLKPTDDVREDRELYLRRSMDGETYVVVKYGFIVQAVIIPTKYLSNGFLEDLGNLYNRCRAELALSNMETKRQEIEAEAEMEDFQGQQDFDPETGEILEEDDGDGGIMPMKTHEERNKEFIRGIIGDNLQDEPDEE